MRWLSTTLSLCALLLAACECGGAPEPEGTVRQVAAPASTATLEGVVRLAEGAELPQWPENPMTPAGRPALPDACTPPQTTDREPVRRVEGGRLTGVLVTLADFETEPPHEPATHELVIRDCRLTPSIVVATRGDTLRLVNQTDYPFMPELGTGMLQAILHEQTREMELAQGGMRTLSCGFTASCGRAEIVTLYHSLHAVTDEDGRFRIENVPANDELRIGAWHPLFREAGERLTLRPGETRRVELVLTPAPPEEPTPPPRDASDGPAENDPDELF